MSGSAVVRATRNRWLRRGKWILLVSSFAAGAAGLTGGPAPSDGAVLDSREVRLRELRQLTFEGENAEAYWSPDGSELIFQSTRPPAECDQIFRIRTDGRGEPKRVSNGSGLTTCGFFQYPQGDRVIFSSTHEASPECPARPDLSQGYVWRLDPNYEIYSARPDGSDLRRLTESPGYDAEATVCFQDGTILFTSVRDGDLELYSMRPDGSEVRRLTRTPGYDGGAFFSPDCSSIVWRASRPEGREFEEYRQLLARNLVRPGKLEIWVADRDGSNARQVTRLGAASFAPYFFPQGDRILFSSNFGDPRGREFELWAIDVGGTRLERVTHSPGFDGFPMFSPDGAQLAFASNRNQAKPGETNLFVARWVEGEPAIVPGRAEDRYFADVAALASPEMEGRRPGTPGIARAADFLEQRFRELGLAPGMGESGYRQAFDVVTSVEVGAGTRLLVGGVSIAPEEFRPLGFSSLTSVEGEVVPAGWGIPAPELGHDDYRSLDVAGKIVLVRRFVPPGEAFSDPAKERRYSDLRFKAFEAKQRGAVGVLIADYGGAEPEAPLPELSPERGGDVGLPVLAVKRAVAERILAADRPVAFHVELEFRTASTENLVARVEPGHPQPLSGAVLVGAHYDHLGWGGPGSLAPGERSLHPGADDNASGVASLLETARALKEGRDLLRRPVWIVAFSAEEMGLLGSSHFVRNLPPGLELRDLVAMLNLDMVGRLRERKLQAFGSESAAEWPEILGGVCPPLGLECTGSGDGFGPSDHTPFYAAGVPVLHLFTGTHGDYHRPTDLPERISATGGVWIAELTAKLAEALSNRERPLQYLRTPGPPPARGDLRSRGASLGTVPDYAGDGQPGVLLAGARPGGAADRAGLRKGDRLVRIAGSEVRSIEDLTYLLRRLEPGMEVEVEYVREGKREVARVVLDAPRRVM